MSSEEALASENAQLRESLNAIAMEGSAALLGAGEFGPETRGLDMMAHTAERVASKLIQEIATEKGLRRAAQERLAYAERLLRTVAYLWNNGLEEGRCSFCAVQKGAGHTDDCKFNAFLAECETGTDTEPQSVAGDTSNEE